jgi:hypothetical protein
MPPVLRGISSSGSRRASATLHALACVGVLAPRVALADASPSAHAYRIEATLDADAHVVRGIAHIRWTNQSRVPIGELWLHLYMNAFESRRTVFMQESGGQLRGARFGAKGRIHLEALRLGERDLLPRADDTIVPDDRTQLRVPLPEPVSPGGVIELTIPFTTTLPEVFARAGYHDQFHMVAQWFPKLARLEPDGTWATFPYHGLGEFYADFARYDVTIDAPAEHVLGATGVEVSTKREGPRTLHRFVAERVHDFAFASWPYFARTEARCGGVDVEVLAPPGYGRTARTARALTCRGLDYYGGLYGRYPYPRLTVVLPPRGAEGAAGMEYPMLFTSDGGWWNLGVVHAGGVEETTAHELAHQWFQGLVATNEVRWPMLDEGLTSWASYDFMASLYGPGRSFAGAPALDYFDVLRPFALRSSDPPPARPVTSFRAASYWRVIYGRVPLVLETLARTYGRRRVHRALGDYARRHRFEHPGPEALYAAFDRTFGPWLAARLLRPALERGEDASVALERRAMRPRAATDSSGGRDAIVGRRIGALPLPLSARVRCEDGRALDLRWPGRDARFEPAFGSSCRPRDVRVDPSAHDLLDPRRADDHLTVGGMRRFAGQALAFALAWIAAWGP